MDSQQIVAFEDQGATDTITKEGASKMPAAALNSISENRSQQHTVIDFIKRPRNIATIVWTSAQAPHTNLGSWLIPYILLSSDMPRCKMSDFRFLTCTVKFTFQLNAQKMAVGQLIATITPFATLAGSQVHHQSLTSLTGYPHGFIDAGSSPSLNLIVPYVNRTAAYDLTDTTPDTPWAQVDLWVMNSLDSAAGTTNADISVWISCVDVELAVPTPNHITVTPAILGIAQSSEAETVTKSGAISSPLKTVSSLAKTVADLGLGPVSEVGAAVSWVTEFASNAAAAFGYSKPNLEGNVDAMVQQPAKYLTNFNGSDNNIILGFDARNTLRIDHKVFGSRKDEMSITEVCSKMCFLETFNWSTSQPAGTVLRQIPVTPGLCGGLSTSEVTPPLLAYVASLFELWRGSLNFKFTFVANSFYNGRIGLAFLPGLTGVGSTVTFDEIEAAPKVICDIRSDRACVFKVPWTMHVPYLKVRLASRASVGPQFTFNGLNSPDSSLGIIVVYVQNSLTATGQVPTTININSFIAGGPDLEFAIPTASRYVPVPYPPTSLVIEGIAQTSLDTPPAQLNVTAGGIPDAMTFLKKSSPPSQSFQAQLCMGERVNSLRQLIRMFNITASLACPGGRGLLIDPRFMDFNNTNSFLTRLGRVSRIYAMRRGGMRYKIVPQSSDLANYSVVNVSSFYDVAGPPQPLGTVGPPPELITDVGFQWFINIAQTPVIEMTIPFYCPYYSDIVSTTNGATSLKAFIRTGIDQDVIYNVYQAASDDFSFGYLIGPPNIQVAA